MLYNYIYNKEKNPFNNYCKNEKFIDLLYKFAIRYQSEIYGEFERKLYFKVEAKSLL
jgi:hypothetical protein